MGFSRSSRSSSDRNGSISSRESYKKATLSSKADPNQALNEAQPSLLPCVCLRNIYTNLEKSQSSGIWNSNVLPAIDAAPRQRWKHHQFVFPVFLTCELSRLTRFSWSRPVKSHTAPSGATARHHPIVRGRHRGPPSRNVNYVIYWDWDWDWIYDGTSGV